MAFLRGAVAEPFSGPGVELCRNAIAVNVASFALLALGGRSSRRKPLAAVGR